MVPPGDGESAPWSLIPSWGQMRRGDSPGGGGGGADIQRTREMVTFLSGEYVGEEDEGGTRLAAAVHPHLAAVPANGGGERQGSRAVEAF